MFPAPNYMYKCCDCGHRWSAHIDKDVTHLLPKCPKCHSDNVEGGSIIKGGPEGEHPYKRY